MKLPETSLLWATLLLLIQTSSVLGGVACYQGCLYACLEVGVFAFANPLGIAVGITGCNTVCMVACASALFVPPACFANDTTIATPSSALEGKVVNKPISEVDVGDEVLTIVDGQLVSTRVVRNLRSSGDFAFFEFETRVKSKSDENAGVSTLKVTPEHTMLLVNASGEIAFSRPADVKIGDKMKSSDGSVRRVSRIGHAMGKEKYTLVTTEGSVLASGMLVSTMCSEGISDEKAVNDTVNDWKLRHQYHLYMDDLQRPLPAGFSI